MRSGSGALSTWGTNLPLLFDIFRLPEIISAFLYWFSAQPYQSIESQPMFAVNGQLSHHYFSLDHEFVMLRPVYFSTVLVGRFNLVSIQGT